MITYRWREALDEDAAREVGELLDEAVEYDAEAGFSTAAKVPRSIVRCARDTGGAT